MSMHEYFLYEIYFRLAVTIHTTRLTVTEVQYQYICYTTLVTVHLYSLTLPAHLQKDVYCLIHIIEGSRSMQLLPCQQQIHKHNNETNQKCFTKQVKSTLEIKQQHSQSRFRFIFITTRNSCRGTGIINIHAASVIMNLFILASV